MIEVITNKLIAIAKRVGRSARQFQEKMSTLMKTINDGIDVIKSEDAFILNYKYFYYLVYNFLSILKIIILIFIPKSISIKKENGGSDILHMHVDIFQLIHAKLILDEGSSIGTNTTSLLYLKIIVEYVDLYLRIYRANA